MENHNFAQTPAKCLQDFLSDLPGFNYAEAGIGGGGLFPQFLNSPYSPNPPADLANIWLASPWPRGAGTSHQEHANLQAAVHPKAALIDPVLLGQRGGLARNVDAFPSRQHATPNKKLPSFPHLEAPCRATVGTQTSPGLECNACIHAKTKPLEKKTAKSVATAPIGNSKKKSSLTQQGASLPPLPKKAKLATIALRVHQQPLHQQQQQHIKAKNYYSKSASMHELTGTSLPSNAPNPSRGTKALDIAKMGPLSRAPSVEKKRLPGRPVNKTKKALAKPTSSTAAAAPSFLPGNGNLKQVNSSTAPTVFHFGARPPTLTAPTATAATTATTAAPVSTVTTFTTTSAYDSTMCEVCGLGEPEESIVLCDGCDLGYHMECLCPALKEVPPGAWFCGGCCNKSPTKELNGNINQQHKHQLGGSGVVAAPSSPPPSLPASQPRIISQALPSAPPPRRRTSNTAPPTQATAAEFGPLERNASRIISLFNSNEPLSQIARAQLRTLIFLAQHGEANPGTIRSHCKAEYPNDAYQYESISKLYASGVIVRVQVPGSTSSTKPSGYYYTLAPNVVPDVEHWKIRLTQPEAVKSSASVDLRSSLCSRNDNGKVRILQQNCRSQLQVLTYLAEHGEAVRPTITKHYKNNYIRHVVLNLVAAKMVLRHRTAGVGTAYCYQLAPGMEQYVDVWKEKLDTDTLMRKALEVNEENERLEKKAESPAAEADV
jgi:PHD-finger